MTGRPAPSGGAARAVGVLGAASIVGHPLLEMLAPRGVPVVACSRRHDHPPVTTAPPATWCRPGAAEPLGGTVPDWIALCPLWGVPEHLAWLESLGIRRLVALSSTSVITKRHSPDAGERLVARRLEEAEAAVTARATARGIDLCLLRPTLIYDGVGDGNVATIAAFIHRRGFFPVAGPARGLRQPVHAADVAAACLAALDRLPLPEAVYTLSGREPLPFCDLVAEVFAACGRRPRILHVPRPLVAVVAPLCRIVGPAPSVAGMAARMNEDLAFDHAAAARDLDFAPRPFAADLLAPAVRAARPSASVAEEAAA